HQAQRLLQSADVAVDVGDDAELQEGLRRADGGRPRLAARRLFRSCCISFWRPAAHFCEPIAVSNAEAPYDRSGRQTRCVWDCSCWPRPAPSLWPPATSRRPTRLRTPRLTPPRPPAMRPPPRPRPLRT